MRTLYMECKMGAAGDMLAAALYELLDEKKKAEFIGQMNAMFGPDIEICALKKQMAGVSGTHMQVRIFGHEELEQLEHAHGPEHTHHNDHEHSSEHTHHNDHIHGSEHTHQADHAQHSEHEHHNDHEHHSYASIMEQIEKLPLTPEVRGHVREIYRLIGEAESKVHQTAIEQIHFHEVGTLDALADVTAVCLLVSFLAPEQIMVSPIHVGNGTVRCAHGVLPVPAPATAELLAGIPFYTGSVDTELCTPTGAAILKHFADGFGAMPAMTLKGTGYGLGTKELPMLNAVRAFLGETGQAAAGSDSDRILDISCNLDDMTGEALGYAMEQLLSAGALDVFYVPIQMKKNRPGVLLHCFCEPERQEDFIRLILRHTTTRGVRYQLFDRKKLTSRFETEESAYGPVARKISEGYGIAKAKYEYEDLKRIAEEQGLSLQELTERLTTRGGSPQA